MKRRVDKSKGILSIGTSNIVVPGNKQSFPENFRDKSRLRYYSSLFNSLEVNSSFYKVPMRATFEKWSQDVPEDFRFSIKLWREITHAKELRFSIDQVNTFLDAASGMGTKKGCLLIQFPGKINFDYYEQLTGLLEAISAKNKKGDWKLAIEFRHRSWYVGETYELLDEFSASVVLHDIPKSRSEELNSQARFVYIRFHGPAGDYKGGYSNAFLQEQMNKIQGWQNAGKDVYVYFNNTIGDAFENARTLMQMADQKT